MLVTVSGMVMDGKLLQPENVLSSILVTPSGITMGDVKLEQPLNANLPMLITLSGMVMDGRLLQP